MTQKQQIENRRELSEKRIVVFCGSSGIGLSVAQQAVAQGATAIIASSNADRSSLMAFPSCRGPRQRQAGRD